MHELQELVDVVTRNKVKSIRLLEPFGDQPPDMLHDFYARLANHQFANDEEAAQFYGYTSASDRGYRKQRDKLRERLYNSAVFIDVNSPKFNDAQKAFYTCQKNLAIIRILEGRNVQNSSYDLIQKTLKYSDKYELTEISLYLYKKIRTYHALRSGNKNAYQKIDKKIKLLQKVFDAEELALHYVELLSLESRNKSSPSAQYFKIGKEAMITLDRCDVNTYRFILLAGSLKSNYLIQKCEYSELLQYCDFILGKLSKKKNTSKAFHAQFHFQKLIGYTQLLDEPNGFLAFQACLKMTESGQVRWFNAHDIYFLLLLRVKKYSDASILYDKIISNESFPLESRKRKETWLMYEAYLYYLVLICKMKSNASLQNFKFSKFINEVPTFSQDKTGYNIPVLIIEILVLLAQKRYDKVQNLIESVEKYSRRHVKKDDNFRSHYFFKLLLLVPKFNFDRDIIEAKAKPYLKKLESVPLSEAKQSFEIEIIPYETLWEYVLESLED